MTEAVEGVIRGEVARASRDATVDGISVREGGGSGWSAAPQSRPTPICSPSWTRSSTGCSQAATPSSPCFSATTRPERRLVEERIRLRHPGLDVLDVHDGGQPHYPLLLAAE